MSVRLFWVAAFVLALTAAQLQPGVLLGPAHEPSAQPVDPFAGGVKPPKPTGLACYGVFNQSGSLYPYTVRAQLLVGLANITSISAYYPPASKYNVSERGVSLQLNAMLVAASPNVSHVYWVQNVVVFETGVARMFYADNVWNMSGPGAGFTNRSITSSGGGYVENTSRGAVYGSSSANYTYKLPLSIRLLLAVKVVVGLGVQVGFGVRVLANGSAVSAPIIWYDNATIHEVEAGEAYFLVDGEKLTPSTTPGFSGLYYDVELVFGGEANGAPTNLTALNATLALLYEGPGGGLEPFPSYYSFGGDTAEAVYDLRVAYLGGGVASVGVGVPDYAYLGGGPAGTYAAGSKSVVGWSNTSVGVAGKPTVVFAAFALALAVVLAVSAALVLRVGRRAGQVEPAG